MMIPYNGSQQFLLLGHRTDSMHKKKVYHQGSSHFCFYAFCTKKKEKQHTDIKPSQGTINKGHSKLTSQHTSPPKLCTFTPTAAVSFMVFTGMYLLLPHVKKGTPKGLFHEQRASQIHFRYAKVHKLLQRLMMLLSPPMPINAFSKNLAWQVI